MINNFCALQHFGALELRLHSANGDIRARSAPFRHGPRLIMRATVEGNRVVVAWQRDWQSNGNIDDQVSRDLVLI